MKKKDDGIYRSDDGKIVLPEDTRDKLAKISEESILADAAKKSADNPDNMTTIDLQNARWSGIRNNHFTGQVELWVAGQIRDTQNAQVIARDPGKLADMYERVFGEPVMVVVDAVSGPNGSKH